MNKKLISKCSRITIVIVDIIQLFDIIVVVVVLAGLF